MEALAHPGGGQLAGRGAGRREWRREGTMHDDEITHIIIGFAIAVRREPGPGMLDSACDTCLAAGLRMRGLRVERRVPILLRGRDIEFDVAFRLDLRMGGRVFVEIKAVEQVRPVHEAQVLQVLRGTGLTVGLLLNFHAPQTRAGIHRIVPRHPE